MNQVESDARSRRIGAALALLALVALAISIRALGFEYVFVGDEIVFAPADAQYHLRRALFTMARFPDVLLFDPYINFPGGASVPWPPLFDFVLGALGWLTGGETRDLERVAAWSGPFCAGLTVVAIHLSGVRLGSRRIGLVAGLVFALLPISVSYSRIGNADHHAAVAMIGAWLLYLLIALSDPGITVRRVVWLGVALFGVRCTMLLTWHGSLLYLAPAEALLVATAVLTGRWTPLGAQAGSALATFVVIAVVLSVSPTPLGGLYSSIALSRLHGLAMAGVTVTAGGLLVVMRLGIARTRAARLLWSVVAAGVFGGMLLAFPGPREGLIPALRFLTMNDEVGSITGEQIPLFASGDRMLGTPATQAWGLFAFLLPLAPLAGWLPGRMLEDRSGARQGGAVLAAWGLFFCSLAVIQRRYGNDAAPAACLLLACALLAGFDALVERLGRGSPHRRIATATATGCVVLLFAPALLAVYAPRAWGSFQSVSAGDEPPPRVERSIAFTIHRFAGDVARVTPETSGFLGNGPEPEYGVIAHANLGHALQYRARRATATDPFWWYIGRENWDRSLAFLRTRSEARALRLAEELDARYVVTIPGLRPGSVAARLHGNDGVARSGQPALRHFRLIIEAPRGSPSIADVFHDDAGGRIPYKLFEIVSGAVIEIDAPPGDLASATVRVRSNLGRPVQYVTKARADTDGVARLTVPYPTTGVEETPGTPIARALGPYQVEAGTTRRHVQVSEQAVREGATVRVPATPDPEAENERDALNRS